MRLLVATIIIIIISHQLHQATGHCLLDTVGGVTRWAEAHVLLGDGSTPYKYVNHFHLFFLLSITHSNWERVFKSRKRIRIVQWLDSNCVWTLFELHWGIQTALMCSHSNWERAFKSRKRIRIVQWLDSNCVWTLFELHWGIQTALMCSP